MHASSANPSPCDGFPYPGDAWNSNLSFPPFDASISVCNNKNRVQEQLLRSLAKSSACTAIAVEQSSRAQRRWFCTEVSPELQRCARVQEVKQMCDAEQAAQTAAPRTPPKQLESMFNDAWEQVVRTGNAARATIEAHQEQERRSATEWMQREVNLEARRHVAAKRAKVAATEEQARRVQQELLRREVVPELTRAHNIKLAQHAVAAERFEQALIPRRPTADTMAAIAAVNVAITSSGKGNAAYFYN